MQCLHPVTLKTVGTVPCGKCEACLLRRQSDWTARLTIERSHSTSCHFITLTYSEENVPIRDGVKCLDKRDCQLFMKRLRRAIEPDRIRFFLCGEYGSTTFRPHYHAIIFNWPVRVDIYQEVHKAWNLGFVVCAPVIPAHIAYVAKYCSGAMFLPPHLRDRDKRPFLLCSRRPAIGSQYLSEHNVSWHRESLSTLLRFPNGTKFALPRYYRDRIFDDQMKADIREASDAYRESQNALYMNKYWSYDRKNVLRPMNDQLKEIQAKKARERLYKNKPDSL